MDKNEPSEPRSEPHMPLKTKVTLNQAAIRGLTDPGGIIDQAVARAAGKTRDRAKENLTQAGRVDTGALRQSIVSERYASTNRSVTYQVGSPLDYAIYNERGTGIYGPRHSYIYPRRAKVLRFRPKGASGYVYARRVRGMHGTRFLERAAYALTDADFA